MEIKNKFDAPFGQIPELRLQYVKRWGTISTNKQQTVAEHSYNVAVITEWLCRELSEAEDDINYSMWEAIHHDDDEIYTGDVPSPAKIRDGNGEFDIVKLADVIESLIFIENHCTETKSVKDWIIKGLLSEIEYQCNGTGMSLNAVKTMVREYIL